MRDGKRDARWSPRLRGFRAAFVFLTRIPVGGFPYRDDDFRWATAYFPAVGLVLGALLGLLAAALLAPLGALVTALLVLTASMLLTGGFHEDGLADTADALGGAFDRERVLEILKDSRVGTYGAAAVTLSIALRAALLARLEDGMPMALALVQSLARTPPLWLMLALPYATRAAVARSPQVTWAGPVQVTAATAFAAAVLLGFVGTGHLSPGRAVALALTGVAVALVTGWRYRARVEGVTGDFLGATEQVGEIALLMVLAWTTG